MNETTTPRLGGDTTKTNGNDAASPEGGAAPRSKDQPEITVPEAAVEEVAVEPKPKSVKFRDLELELPTDLPGTVALDWAEIEDGKKEVSPVVNLIKSIIGLPQYNLMYDKIRDEGLTMDETLTGLTELSEAIFASYGTSSGESSASDGS